MAPVGPHYLMRRPFRRRYEKLFPICCSLLVLSFCMFTKSLPPCDPRIGPPRSDGTEGFYLIIVRSRNRWVSDAKAFRTQNAK
jgi:hypothetical protein